MTARLKFLGLGATGLGGIRWGIRHWRKRRIRPKLDQYPFKVLPPGAEDVQKRILRGRDDDYPLDAHRIPYQRRVPQTDQESKI